MAAAALVGSLGLFGDELFTTTDLNRRTGEVLNHARKAPVTISRNGEQFALLRREKVADLIKAALQFGPTLELLEGALCVAEGKDPPTSLAWLKAFEIDDLRKMIREVLVTSISALRETGDWEAVTSVIHEWHESALLAMSGIYEEAMSSPADESLPPLPDPRTFIDQEK
jgi:hypothetical protein